MKEIQNQQIQQVLEDIQNQQIKHILVELITNKKEKSFVSLDQESRQYIPTDNAAHYLARSPQTLRSWACLENGPIRPIRIHGRLFWSTAEIKALLNVEA